MAPVLLCSAVMDTSSAPYETAPRRWTRPSAGVVALAALVLLLIAVAVGVYTSRQRGQAASGGSVTIAQLLADPDRYDEQNVTLSGAAEDVRELPYLSQYALYTFRDATGTLQILSQRGTPPAGTPVQLTGSYHAKIGLDEALKRIVEERFGSLAGMVVGAVVPDVGLHVVFMEHLRYAQP
jgi:hypothetical protein